MPKKKRTRKDKIQADLKRQSSPSLAHPTRSAAVSREAKDPVNKTEESKGTFSLPEKYASASTKSSKSTIKARPVEINTAAYSYISGDLLKTTVLSIAIIGAELLIYFTMMK